MSKDQAHIAIFPGAFDPLTHGHLDVIRRAAGLYDRLIVAVGRNPEKTETFTPEERLEMLVHHTREWSNVEARTYEGLTVEYARHVGAQVILRGIRDTGDLHSELEIATANLMMGQIETVFLMTSREHVLTSSTLIKQIVGIGHYDADQLARLVPLDVARRLADRLHGKTHP